MNYGYFPAICEVDPEDGSWFVEVVGNGVNAQGPTMTVALDEASQSLQEIVWDALNHDEPLPRPAEPSEEDLARGRLAMLQITMPAMAAQ
jgi:predicted RNase H-like HicB family nuclease